MESYIYIDQYTLSDRREKKLKETGDTDIRKLKELLKKDNYRLVYSDTHLQEISQITKKEYQKEHIDLLSELGARVVNKLNHRTRNTLGFKTPAQLMHNHLAAQAE